MAAIPPADDVPSDKLNDAVAEALHVMNITGHSQKVQVLHEGDLSNNLREKIEAVEKEERQDEETKKQREEEENQRNLPSPPPLDSESLHLLAVTQLIANSTNITDALAHIANNNSAASSIDTKPERPGQVVIVINNEQDSKSLTVAPSMIMEPTVDAPPLDSLSSDEKEAVISEGILLLVIVLAVSLFGAHFFRRRKIRSIQMPFLATCLGLLVGVILKYGFKEHTILERILAFNNDVFFMLLLPPIIFESGFALSGVRANEFFKNFGTIMWFAFFATSMSFALIGATIFFAGYLHLSMPFTIRESFAFGALISSTDPVSVVGIFKDLHALPALQAIVSGESLLNDAISIVLYRIIANGETSSGAGTAIASFIAVFCASTSIGVVVGLFSALVYRFMDLHKDENQMLESALLLLFPWSSYLVSDGFSQSGIVSILFCGMTMGKYTFPNLSNQAKQTSISMFGTLALLAETVVFVFLGIGVFSFPQRSATFGLFFCTLLFVTSARALSVYATSAIVNLFRGQNRLTLNIQHSLVICGLRGAIAFALALRARHDFGGPNGSAILSATLFYALFTILVVGGCLVWCFDRLGVFIGDDSQTNSYSIVGASPRSRDEVLAGGRCGCLKRCIIRLDENILKRVLTNSQSSRAVLPASSEETQNANSVKSVTTAFFPEVTIKGNSSSPLFWEEDIADSTLWEEGEITNDNTGRYPYLHPYRPQEREESLTTPTSAGREEENESDESHWRDNLEGWGDRLGEPRGDPSSPQRTIVGRERSSGSIELSESNELPIRTEHMEKPDY